MKYSLDITEEEMDFAKTVLKPTGYRILVAVAKTSDKIGSVLIPDQRKSDEDVASVLGKVIELGPDAYSDAERFPNGPYCAPRDVVFMASYSGRRFKINDREYRLINDDTVMAVALKPEEIERA